MLCGAQAEGTEAQAESAPAQDAKEALFESLVYELGVCASENADHPELNVAVRNMLALMEEYYTQNAEAMAGTLEKVRLSQRMADTIRHLKAWERATGSYDRALADYEALPEAERNKTDVKRMLSALCNGKAFCLVNLLPNVLRNQSEMRSSSPLTNLSSPNLLTPYFLF